MSRYTKTTWSKNYSNLPNINLRLCGFAAHCRVATLQEIVKLIDRLPAFHLAGLREIEYLTHDESKEYLLPEGMAAWLSRKAEFVQRERKILMFNVAERDLLFHVLLHEIGHFVYFLVISSTLKNYWVTQVYPGAPCVTLYGHNNAVEDFAETYAIYVLDPKRLQVIPAKHSFMHNLVFSGESVTLKEYER